MLRGAESDYIQQQMIFDDLEFDEDLHSLSESSDQSFSSRKKSKKKMSKNKENSLATLTKKFVHAIKSEEDQTLSLKAICQKLRICKRRAYDLTNVLEGLGMVDKDRKTQYHWVGLEGEELERVHGLGRCLLERTKKPNESDLKKGEKWERRVRKLYERHARKLNFELEEFLRDDPDEAADPSQRFAT